MPTTIALPDDLANKLQAGADAHQVSLDEWVTRLLANALEYEADEEPTLAQVIANIQATRPNPAAFHPATQSLAEQLAHSPDESTFDARDWNREWAKLEAEMKAITRANSLVEGRA